MRAFLQRCPNDFLFPDSLLLVSFAIFSPLNAFPGRKFVFAREASFLVAEKSQFTKMQRP